MTALWDEHDRRLGKRVDVKRCKRVKGREKSWDQGEVATSQSIWRSKGIMKSWGLEYFSKSTLMILNRLFFFFSLGEKKTLIGCESHLADVDSFTVLHWHLLLLVTHRMLYPQQTSNDYRGAIQGCIRVRHKFFWSYREGGIQEGTSQSRRRICMGGLTRSRCLLLIVMTWHLKNFPTCNQMLTHSDSLFCPLIIKGS